MIISAKMPVAQNQTLSAKSIFQGGKGSKGFSVLWLITACLLVYWPVFSHEFQLYWDDQWVVMNQYTEDGLGFENLFRILTEYYHGQYAPVNEAYYLFLYNLTGGYNPLWFHAGSLLIHISNALLLYFLLLRLLQRSAYFSAASVQRISLLTALLLAIHPFLVETVAWLSASKIILYALFYLIALHLYLFYLSADKHQVKYYLLTLLLFIVSFGAKEQAVTLPCSLLLIDYALKRDLRQKQVWLEKIPFFALAIFFGIITMLSQASNGGGALSGEKTYPFYQNIVFATYTVCEYLIKSLIPIKLSYLYPFPNLPGESLPVRFWLYPAALLLVIFGLLNFWKKRWVLFGIAFFIVNLSVALNIIPTSRFAIIADRYAYMASIGIFFLLAYFLDQAVLLQVKYLKPLILAGCLYIAALGIYAHERSKVWHNSDTLKKEIREILKNRKDYDKYMKERS